MEVCDDRSSTHEIFFTVPNTDGARGAASPASASPRSRRIRQRHRRHIAAPPAVHGAPRPLGSWYALSNIASPCAPMFALVVNTSRVAPMFALVVNTSRVAPMFALVVNVYAGLGEHHCAGGCMRATI